MDPEYVIFLSFRDKDIFGLDIAVDYPYEDGQPLSPKKCTVNVSHHIDA